MPLAVMLLPAGLALFYGAAAGAARLLARRVEPRAGACLGALGDRMAARPCAHGFPWNMLGYALTYPLALMQSAAVLGIYGLTLLCVAIFAGPPVLIGERDRRPAPTRRLRGARRCRRSAADALRPAAPGGCPLQPATMVAGVKIRIVQPSVPQRESGGRRTRPASSRITRPVAPRPLGRHDNLAGITHRDLARGRHAVPAARHPEALSAIGELLPAGTLPDLGRTAG